MDNFVVYLLMRTDLPSMNPGKAMAQAMHAGHQIKRITYPAAQNMIDKYLDNHHGFGTVITLGVSREQLMSTLKKADEYICSLVSDPTYPFFVDKEVVPFLSRDCTVATPTVEKDGKVLCTRFEATCGWFFGDKNDPVFVNLFEGLELHP